ncbi:Exportin-T [Trichinella pseudospiralis]
MTEQTGNKHLPNIETTVYELYDEQPDQHIQFTYPWPPVALVNAVIRVISASAAINLDDNFPSMNSPLHSHNNEHNLFGSGANHKEEEMGQESKAVNCRISARYGLTT